ncbi:hypothetical protein L0128_20180, partial [candidate division KSB1 bacterium]|nr:hypothetical protein [candidate division KSB1 bacterium]
MDAFQKPASINGDALLWFLIGKLLFLKISVAHFSSKNGVDELLPKIDLPIFHRRVLTAAPEEKARDSYFRDISM